MAGLYGSTFNTHALVRSFNFAALGLHVRHFRFNIMAQGQSAVILTPAQVPGNFKKSPPASFLVERNDLW
jgi:hypothetical protein